MNKTLSDAAVVRRIQERLHERLHLPLSERIISQILVLQDEVFAEEGFFDDDDDEI